MDDFDKYGVSKSACYCTINDVCGWHDNLGGHGIYGQNDGDEEIRQGIEGDILAGERERREAAHEAD